MPKISMPKSSPSLDMTPMVDLAFLLVTFFMLTASFREPEPVQVDSPSSISEKMIPNQHFMILIDEKSRVFLDVSPAPMKELLYATVYSLFNKDKVAPGDQVKNFGQSASIGMPWKMVPEYLSKTGEERAEIEQTGIPYDTTKPIEDWELFKWAKAAVKITVADLKEKTPPGTKVDYSKRIKFAIKGDGRSKYNEIMKAVRVYRELGITEFQMITNYEDDPEARKLKGQTK